MIFTSFSLTFTLESKSPAPDKAGFRTMCKPTSPAGGWEKIAGAPTPHRLETKPYVETLRKATSLQRVNALAFLAQPNCNLENRTTKVPMSVIGARDVRVGHQLLQPSPTLNSFY